MITLLPKLTNLLRDLTVGDVFLHAQKHTPFAQHFIKLQLVKCLQDEELGKVIWELDHSGFLDSGPYELSELKGSFYGPIHLEP